MQVGLGANASLRSGELWMFDGTFVRNPRLLPHRLQTTREVGLPARLLSELPSWPGWDA